MKKLIIFLVLMSTFTNNIIGMKRQLPTSTEKTESPSKRPQYEKEEITPVPFPFELQIKIFFDFSVYNSTKYNNAEELCALYDSSNKNDGYSSSARIHKPIDRVPLFSLKNRQQSSQ